MTREPATPRGADALLQLEQTEAELKSAQQELLAAKERLEEKVAQRTAELERVNAQLEARNRSLDAFLSLASHDLKTPMRGIVSATEWLTEDLSGVLDADSKETLELLGARARRMAMLVDGILDYCRFSMTEAKPEPVDLARLIAEVFDDSGLPPGTIARAPSNLPTIFVVRSHLCRILLNLVTNAGRFCDKPVCEISVGLSEAERHWQFVVSDNGPGIEQRYHKQIFTMFRTLQSRDAVESSGIGLALVKELVEGMGGRIWLDSQLGEGTSFCFTIAKRDPVLDPETEPVDGRQALRHSRWRVGDEW